MTVVKGTDGAELTETVSPAVPPALTPLGAGTEVVGASVMVDGTAVTIPGF